MEKELKIQPQLLSHLQEELGEHVDLIQWLMDELGFSQSSAYRTIQGKKKLSLEECFQILLLEPKVFARISDSFEFRDRVMVRLNIFYCEDSFQKYLLAIIKIFENALSSDGACKLIYTARDLPIFYFLAQPRLLEYKYAYWNCQLRDEGPISLTAETHRLAQQVYQLYMDMPSLELWHPLAYQQQLYLLSDAYRDGSISDQQHDHIKADLEKLMQNLQEQVLVAKKPTGHALSILHANLHGLDNFGILQYGGKNLLMSALPIARFFSSSNEKLLDNYLFTFEDHRRRAVPITDEGKVIRRAWFQNLINPTAVDPLITSITNIKAQEQSVA